MGSKYWPENWGLFWPDIFKDIELPPLSTTVGAPGQTALSSTPPIPPIPSPPRLGPGSGTGVEMSAAGDSVSTDGKAGGGGGGGGAASIPGDPGDGMLPGSCSWPSAALLIRLSTAKTRTEAAAAAMTPTS